MNGYHGKYIALLNAQGRPLTGIRWRVRAYDANGLSLRSVDGDKPSRIGWNEFAHLELSRRIGVFSTDPGTDRAIERKEPNVQV